MSILNTGLILSHNLFKHHNSHMLKMSSCIINKSFLKPWPNSAKKSNKLSLEKHKILSNQSTFDLQLILIIDAKLQKKQFVIRNKSDNKHKEKPNITQFQDTVAALSTLSSF